MNFQQGFRQRQTQEASIKNASLAHRTKNSEPKSSLKTLHLEIELDL